MDQKQCCPKFNPEKWDKKTFNWQDKKFIKESLPTFFHIPFPPMIAKKITKMWNLVQKSDAALPNPEETLVLFRDPSPFKSEIYFATAQKVKEANNTTLSGTFMTMVFDQPCNAIPKCIKKMKAYLQKQNKKAKDYLVHYAYCPGCAKKFGRNYFILFAKV